MSENLTTKEREFLLKLARQAIGHYLKTGQKLAVSPGDVPSERLAENGAVFVTLYKGKRLRGCIGSLEAKRPLVFDVVENALYAAFGDPRFPPLTAPELPDIRISISVLTKPEALEAKDAVDLLKKLIPEKHGLIIRKGFAQATFLPVVWKELPKKEQFLAELCQKAGLMPDEWKKTDEMEFFVYETEEFGE